MGSDTRAKLVETARRLFWIGGFEATSVATILEEAGVNSGSLYHFFDSKEDLLLAVLERYEELLHPAVVEPARRATTDPIETIFAILEGYRTQLVASDFTHGCPIGNLALEVAEMYPAAREGIRRNLAGWREAVENLVREAKQDLPEEVNPAGLAAMVLSVMEGGVMLARVERDIAPFDACVEELRRYFRSLVAGDEEVREAGKWRRRWQM